MIMKDDLEAELGFDISKVFKTQTNLKNAYKLYQKLEKEHKDGQNDAEIANLYEKMRVNQEAIVKKM